MLITDSYREQQEKLHENPDYGVASVFYAPQVTKIINGLKVTTVLDYGCGKGRLAQHVFPEHRFAMYQYDPAMPEFAGDPFPVQMVVCIDVLEHIEPECLDDVLDDLARLSLEYAFLTIHTGPAAKTLEDGRNAHLIQEDMRWWLPKIWDRWNIMSCGQSNAGFHVLCSALQATEPAA